MAVVIAGGDMARAGVLHAAGAAIVLAGLAFSNLVPANAQGIVFRSGVEMVPLTVTVTDGSGDYVTGLDRGDFTIFENGVPQQIAFFAAGTVPIDVALVLDASSSMRVDMPLVRRAATGLLDALRDGDRGAVLAVKQSVNMPQGFTTELNLVAQAVQSVPAAGSTAVYDGLYIALNELVRERRRQTQVRRQVLVLLSDGLDNASLVTIDRVIETARRVGASIYVVAMERSTLRFEPELKRAADRALFDMRALARDTGGRLFRPNSAEELPGIYGAIARELVSQYDLGYIPADHEAGGEFRRVAVRVAPTRRSAVARTRSGYYADGTFMMAPR